MDRRFIVDASPLILLARIGRLDLLEALASDIRVPQRVFEELHAGAHEDQAAATVRASYGIRLVPDGPIPEGIRHADLGPGESQVLAHAISRKGSEVIIDDRAARNCARALGIPFLGTLGVVVTCRRLGILEAARPIVEALRKQGIRLAPSVVEAALAEVGEADTPKVTGDGSADRMP